ncbi:MAG: oligopeptide/dipeptide ABC transporter ATP-binding protein, partial [Limisphaerales bacterium]
DIADRVGVMYAGQIVEEGTALDVLQRPRHPYTQALLRSVPELGRAGRRLESIPGTVPRPGDWPTGCRFTPRCPKARSECSVGPIDWNPGSIDHAVRCPYAEA